MRTLTLASLLLTSAFALTVGCGSSFGTAGAGTSSATGAGGAGTSAGKGGSGKGGATGKGGAAGPGGATGAGGAACPTLGDKCLECAAASCPQTYCACATTPGCAALASCDEACTTADCRVTCAVNNPSNISQAALAGDCAARACAAQCPGAVRLDPCSTCLYTKCSQQMDACFAVQRCGQLVLCLDGCKLHPNDLMCQPDCMANAGHDAVQLFGEIQVCSMNSCPPPVCKTQTPVTGTGTGMMGSGAGGF